ncbi:Ppx/GppA phosphatase family protein [Corynebacterium epidermidicanis]|uniref:Ppx/GppA phosphatase family n=1 Tax=Corynebacterium epidermidicanis TaxID=1050174 RepID=A0A0G3GV85_9CORY|nr:Ppx/GppA phosphatase family protein [Corynebacterium epidermidicanis]AKK02742.1 Ppx/GppA phosphatase family [Corynebacterium epidermidicanis]
MGRFAAVDCGTNSIRLLISDNSSGEFVDVVREMRIIRLGEGVDATGEISAAALERAREALQDYVTTMKQHGVEAVRMVATSATRDARNRADFISMTAQLLGEIQPGAQAEEITGEEEAKLSFLGAIADLPSDLSPVCVIDLGGGSTEFIVGTRAGEVLAAKSVQMGCVRLTERFMQSDPPVNEEIATARAYVDDRLAEVVESVPLADAQAFVGVAGTFTTLSALAQGLEEYDPAYIHGSELRFDASRILTQSLIGETAALRAAHPVIHPGRADVISGGAVVVEEIMSLISQETGLSQMIISEKDILDGIVMGLAS